MIAIWKSADGDEVSPIAHIAFVQGGATIYLTDGRHFPIRLDAEPLLELRRQYHANAIKRLLLTFPLGGNS
jgi:hypothetical protein